MNVSTNSAVCGLVASFVVIGGSLRPTAALADDRPQRRGPMRDGPPNIQNRTLEKPRLYHHTAPKSASLFIRHYLRRTFVSPFVWCLDDEQNTQHFGAAS